MSLPQPLGARVLVKPQEPEDVTDSGLVMVRDYAEPDVIGIVLRLGLHAASVCPECGHVETCPVSEGQTVVFPPTSGQAVVIDGERYLMVPTRDLLAILEDEHDVA